MLDPELDTESIKFCFAIKQDISSTRDKSGQDL